MNIKEKLNDLNLDSDNSIVIGSGILNALDIRESHDIDLVANKTTYERLKADGRFKISENHGREILTDELFEIGTEWGVLGRSWNFEDLSVKSVVIEGVRYSSPEFLLEVKKSWVATGESRPKDINDIKLIEDYLNK